MNLKFPGGKNRNLRLKLSEDITPMKPCEFIMGQNVPHPNAPGGYKVVFDPVCWMRSEVLTIF